MKVLGASILDTVERFLHPGYISAQPTSAWPRVEREILSPEAYPAQAAPDLQLDVAEALRLQGEQLAAAAVSGDPTGVLAAGASGPSWCALVLGALCVTGVAAAYHLASRNPTRPKGRQWRWALASGVAATLALAAACGSYHADEPHSPLGSPTAEPASPESADDTAAAEPASPESAGDTEAAEPASPESTADSATPPAPEAQVGTVEPTPPPEPPWAGVELREYENPEQATQVILYGLIGNALIHRSSSLDSLAWLTGTISLPTPTPTAGQAYALQTFGLDGWGNELRIDADTSYHVVRSAGVDETFDTEDDLVLRVPHYSAIGLNGPAPAMATPSAWYVVETQNAPYVLFYHPPVPVADVCDYAHACCYITTVRNEATAAMVSGSSQFGLFTMADLPLAAQNIQTRYDEIAAQVTYKPLVLEVFGV
jgi:hypothetical protein